MQAEKEAGLSKFRSDFLPNPAVFKKDFPELYSYYESDRKVNKEDAEKLWKHWLDRAVFWKDDKKQEVPIPMWAARRTLVTCTHDLQKGKRTCMSFNHTSAYGCIQKGKCPMSHHICLMCGSANHGCFFEGKCKTKTALDKESETIKKRYGLAWEDMEDCVPDVVRAQMCKPAKAKPVMEREKSGTPIAAKKGFAALLEDDNDDENEPKRDPPQEQTEEITPPKLSVESKSNNMADENNNDDFNLNHHEAIHESDHADLNVKNGSAIVPGKIGTAALVGQIAEQVVPVANGKDRTKSTTKPKTVPAPARPPPAAPLEDRGATSYAAKVQAKTSPPATPAGAASPKQTQIQWSPGDRIKDLRLAPSKTPQVLEKLKSLVLNITLKIGKNEDTLRRRAKSDLTVDFMDISPAPKGTPDSDDGIVRVLCAFQTSEVLSTFWNTCSNGDKLADVISKVQLYKSYPDTSQIAHTICVVAINANSALTVDKLKEFMSTFGPVQNCEALTFFSEPAAGHIETAWVEFVGEPPVHKVLAKSFKFRTKDTNREVDALHLPAHLATEFPGLSKGVGDDLLAVSRWYDQAMTSSTDKKRPPAVPEPEAEAPPTPVEKPAVKQQAAAVRQSPPLQQPPPIPVPAPPPKAERPVATPAPPTAECPKPPPPAAPAPAPPPTQASQSDVSGPSSPHMAATLQPPLQPPPPPPPPVALENKDDGGLPPPPPSQHQSKRAPLNLHPSHSEGAKPPPPLSPKLPPADLPQHLSSQIQVPTTPPGLHLNEPPVPPPPPPPPRPVSGQLQPSVNSPDVFPAVAAKQPPSAALLPPPPPMSPASALPDVKGELQKLDGMVAGMQIVIEDAALIPYPDIVRAVREYIEQEQIGWLSEVLEDLDKIAAYAKLADRPRKRLEKVLSQKVAES